MPLTWTQHVGGPGNGEQIGRLNPTAVEEHQRADSVSVVQHAFQKQGPHQSQAPPVFVTRQERFVPPLGPLQLYNGHSIAPPPTGMGSQAAWVVFSFSMLGAYM